VSGHSAGLSSQFKAVAWMLGPPTVLGVLLYGFTGGLAATFGGVLVVVSLLAWLVFALYSVFYKTIIDTSGDAFGRIFFPSGKSTPPAKALSHIETMAVRGDLAKAVAAYKAEIATDPADVTSCERLGTLAMRQLADYDLAVWAYREAERRAETPARRFGFALIVVGICRDQLKDRGRTVVELRRLVQLYPDAPRIADLKAELDELKAGLFDDHGE
jgi:cytochrome c-type biogenesis protein CcmH/NrfG